MFFFSLYTFDRSVFDSHCLVVCDETHEEDKEHKQIGAVVLEIVAFECFVQPLKKSFRKKVQGLIQYFNEMSTIDNRKSDCFTKYSRIMQLQGINIVKNLMKLFYFFLFFDLHDSPDSWEWPHLSGWLLAPVLCWWSLPCSLLQHLSRGYSTLLEEWSQHFDFPFESQLLYYEDDPTEVDLMIK